MKLLTIFIRLFYWSSFSCFLWDLLEREDLVLFGSGIIYLFGESIILLQIQLIIYKNIHIYTYLYIIYTYFIFAIIQISIPNPSMPSLSLPPKQYSFKPLYIITRCILNCMIYYSIFNQPGFTDQLCGPLAIPISTHLYQRITYIQILYMMWPILLYISSIISKSNTRFNKLTQINTFKIIFMLFVKFVIIFAQEQRLLYYGSVMLLEGGILVFTILFDIVGQPKISEAWEIVITDSLQRIAIFYELTRSFCPNFAIYWFVTNLLILILSQIQAHMLYNFPKSSQLDPVYPGSLYVKQDIYRISIMTFIYFGIFSILQCSSYGKGMLITFCITIIPFFNLIVQINQGQYKKSIIWNIIICMCIVGLLWIRVNYPLLFKPIIPKNYGICGIFDRQ